MNTFLNSLTDFTFCYQRDLKNGSSLNTICVIIIIIFFDDIT